MAASHAGVLVAVNELKTHHGHQECRNLCGIKLWRQSAESIYILPFSGLGLGLHSGYKSADVSQLCICVQGENGAP